MRRIATVYCSTPDIVGAFDTVSGFFDVRRSSNLVGDPELTVHLDSGSIRVSACIRQSPSDRFDRMMVGAFSRALHGEQTDGRDLPKMLGECELVLTVVASDSLTPEDSPWDCVNSLANRLGGVVLTVEGFSGPSMSHAARAECWA